MKDDAKKMKKVVHPENAKKDIEKECEFKGVSVEQVAQEKPLDSAKKSSAEKREESMKKDIEKEKAFKASLVKEPVLGPAHTDWEERISRDVVIKVGDKIKYYEDHPYWSNHVSPVYELYEKKDETGNHFLNHDLGPMYLGVVEAVYETQELFAVKRIPDPQRGANFDCDGNIGEYVFRRNIVEVVQ